MISLWLFILGNSEDQIVTREDIALVEDVGEDVDFFGFVGSRAPVKKPTLIPATSSALFKAIGQLGGKSAATRLKGQQALQQLQRTNTIPLKRKTPGGVIKTIIDSNSF